MEIINNSKNRLKIFNGTKDFLLKIIFKSVIKTK